MARKSTSKGIGLEVACSPSVTRDQRERERRWQAESDLRTLQQAEEIKGDRGRLNMAKRFAAQQVKVLSKVTGRKR